MRRKLAEMEEEAARLKEQQVRRRPLSKLHFGQYSIDQIIVKSLLRPC
jgi:hypothetical protein